MCVVGVAVCVVWVVVVGVVVRVLLCRLECHDGDVRWSVASRTLRSLSWACMFLTLFLLVLLLLLLLLLFLLCSVQPRVRNVCK